MGKKPVDLPVDQVTKLEFVTYSNAMNSGTVSPACAMMPRKVPRFRSSLCIGTVTLRRGSVVWISRQWLPEVRDTTNPAL
jgi:hypothetical protein